MRKLNMGSGQKLQKNLKINWNKMWKKVDFFLKITNKVLGIVLVKSDFKRPLKGQCQNCSTANKKSSNKKKGPNKLCYNFTRSKAKKLL